MRGTVVFFSAPKGWGFIKPEVGGEDIFCHFSAISKDGYKSLDEGDFVEFDTEVGGPKNKLQAANVVVLQKAVVA